MKVLIFIGNKNKVENSNTVDTKHFIAILPSWQTIFHYLGYVFKLLHHFLVHICLFTKNCRIT